MLNKLWIEVTSTLQHKYLQVLVMIVKEISKLLDDWQTINSKVRKVRTNLRMYVRRDSGPENPK